MAAGGTFVFEEHSKDVLEGLHDFSNDTFKMCLLNNTSAPAASDATPTYSDYSANECSGTGYTSGGEEVTIALSESGGVTTIDYSIVTFSFNSAGPTDIYHGLIYNDTAANKNAVGSIDLGGPLSMRIGDVTVDANASGFFKLTVSNP